ncbi:MAG TPA: hypothetical protein VL598_16135 [Trinickia sp.]|jgi:hypothetical protein|uniref:hypothetical protein n=1 Tax=Trinickia sp. TaxID=2571163 RepID=UPI002B83E076|nr:hypothetical protein [Trinickia sp.]HTI19180.1 hypothetical protein [Trinickia sp.]
MSFVARRIARPPEHEPWPVKLVYRAGDLEPLRELAAYAQAARQTADGIVESAHRRAEELEARSAHEAAHRLSHADAALLKRAISLEAAYRARCDALVARLEVVLDTALENALRGIAVRVPAAQRVGIVAEALRRQLQPGPAARLHLAAGDAHACRAAALTLPWPVEVDENLSTGTCRLSLQDAEWVLAFDALIEGYAINR